MTTRAMISEWFDQGVQQKATHMIVVCDRLDLEDYPVYVPAGVDVRELAVTKYSGQNMQKMMEVYNLSKPKDEQIQRDRCYEW